MACSRCSIQQLRVPILTISRSVTTTSIVQGRKRTEPVLRKWGLESFPREHNSSKLPSLVDLPDFTYLDGRPTPLTKEQLEKKEMNYKLAKRIVMLTNEMKEAKAAVLQKKQDEAAMRENILNSKLKPKSKEL